MQLGYGGHDMFLETFRPFAGKLGVCLNLAKDAGEHHKMLTHRSSSCFSGH